MTGEQLSFEGIGGPPPIPSPRPVLGYDPAQIHNAQRIVDLASLGYLLSPVLDCTYGFGAFWNGWYPERLVATDDDPDKARDVRCDFHALPFRDRAFATVVFDPPYKSGRGGSTMGGRDIAHRYGAQGNLTASVIGRPWLSGLPECLRVADQYCIVKCQDQTTAWQSYDVVTLACSLGWKMRDLLLLGNKIVNPNDTLGLPQRFARRNYSAFVVLRRSRIPTPRTVEA